MEKKLPKSERVKLRRPKARTGEAWAFFEKAMLSQDKVNCIEWPFKLTNGRPAIIYKEKEGWKNWLASRLMCTLIYGEAPTKSHQASHTCHNPMCINPHHLEWLLPREHRIKDNQFSVEYKGTILGRTGRAQKYFHDVVMAYTGNDCLGWLFHHLNNGRPVLKYEGLFHSVARLICYFRDGAPLTLLHEASHTCDNRWCVNPNHIGWEDPDEHSENWFLRNTK